MAACSLTPCLQVVDFSSMGIRLTWAPMAPYQLILDWTRPCASGSFANATVFDLTKRHVKDMEHIFLISGVVRSCIRAAAWNAFNLHGSGNHDLVT